MIFRAAKESDVDAIMYLIRKRIAWMDEKGLYQWNRPQYLETYPRAYFLANIRYFILAVEHGRTVGAMALYETDDRWEADETAYYIHHLVSDPGIPGIGSALLRYAEQYAAENHIFCLRLDSAKGNPGLGAYYEAHGYQPSGECVDGPYTGVKREKRLGQL